MPNQSMHSASSEFILSELSRVGRGHRVSGNEVLIVCPFHSDGNPSCGVSLTDGSVPAGTYHCWSCGASGNWNRLARELGMGRLGPESTREGIGEIVDGRRAYRRLERMLEEDPGDGGPWTEWKRRDDRLARGFMSDINRDWRSIPLRVLKRLGAATVTFDDGSADIVLPVTVRGVTWFTVTSPFQPERRTCGPRYRTSPGAEVDEYGLFGFDLALSMKRYVSQRTIFVTEGPRDALNLVSHGYPAVALLGAPPAVSVRRGELIAGARPRRVLVMMDSDEAGRNAAKGIRRCWSGVIHASRLRSVRLRGGDGRKLDPAMLSPQQLGRIWDRYVESG